MPTKFIKTLKDFKASALASSMSMLYKALPKKIKYAVYRRAVEEKISKGIYFPNQISTLTTLKTLGWDPKSIIDIGAYIGEWSLSTSNIFTNASFLMIEPQTGKSGILADICAMKRDWQHATALLGATNNAEACFAEMETGSSVFEENSSIQRRYMTRKLTTLDTLLEQYPRFRSPCMIKLDTQGYELEILKGSPKALEYAQGVLIETSLIPVNQGAPIFHDVISFMHQAGFEVFDFCSQIRRKDGVLWQTDLMFLRPCHFNIDHSLNDGNWD